MIGENVPEQHEKARAELAAKVAEFEAQGGEIRDCASAKPSPGVTPEQHAPLASADQPPNRVPKSRIRVTSAQRTERFFRREARARALAELVENIRTHSRAGISRDAAAKLLGISSQRLGRLVTEHGIDFPKWRRSA